MPRALPVAGTDELAPANQRTDDQLHVFRLSIVDLARRVRRLWSNYSVFWLGAVLVGFISVGYATRTVNRLQIFNDHGDICRAGIALTLV
jgi:hypothetical protein